MLQFDTNSLDYSLILYNLLQQLYCKVETMNSYTEQHSYMKLIGRCNTSRQLLSVNLGSSDKTKEFHSLILIPNQKSLETKLNKVRLLIPAGRRDQLPL